MALNILVISQSDELGGLLCRFLASEGHQPVCSTGERQPLQQALEKRPDLIIIEIVMAELAAMETVSGLHRSTATRHIPVIIISDFPELELELLHIFDFICKPVDLGRLREDIGLLTSGARTRGAAIKFPPLSNEEHELFHDFLILHCGLHFERRNIRVLERGLESRMTALRIGSFKAYFDYLGKNMERRQELQKLLQLLTVGETFFFRYHAHFEALSRSVLPQLLNNGLKKTLRIWSAGCSTGEEPYSIAMTIMESIPYWQRLDIKIIATDINNRSLSRAREGVYNAWKVRVTEKSCLTKYFKQIGESYVVKDEVKALVDFSYYNLQSPPLTDGETFDIIFCRNVMIYFTTATTRKIVENFAASLHQGGYLFLGHSETLSYISSKFERYIHDGGFYYRKKSDAPGKVLTPPETAVASVKGSRPAAPPPKAAPTVAPEPTPEALYTKGMSQLQQEDYPAAAATLEALLQKQPDHAGAILALGQLHLAGSRVVEALDCCNQALACDDLLADGYFLRGLLYEMLEQDHEAFDEYRKAMLLQMDFVMPHYQLGKLFFRSGDRKSGLRELKNSLKILEKCRREAIIPYSGGLSREVFIGQLREEIDRVETVIAEEAS